MDVLSLWWILPGLLGLWLRSLGGAENEGKRWIGDLLVMLVFMYFMATYVFHGLAALFFILGFLFFTMALGLLIRWIQKSRDVFVIETTLQGEEVEYPTGERYVVPYTGIRIERVPESQYRNIRHVGDLRIPWWNYTRIIHTDYFDEDSGLCFHPEDGRLHNINFIAAKRFWLGLKEELPDLIMENQSLKFNRDIDIAIALDNMAREAIGQWSGLGRVTNIEDYLGMKKKRTPDAYGGERVPDPEKPRTLKMAPPKRVQQLVDRLQG